MPNILYSLQTYAGSEVRGCPDVNVLGRNGNLIRVPCAGCEYHERALEAEGHYVKVVASHFTTSNPYIKYPDWHQIPDHKVVLGWRTAAASKAPVAGFVVFLLLDVKGKLIIVDRNRDVPTR
jgi:hypothetical protein